MCWLFFFCVCVCVCHFFFLVQLFSKRQANNKMPRVISVKISARFLLVWSNVLSHLLDAVPSIFVKDFAAFLRFQHPPSGRLFIHISKASYTFTYIYIYVRSLCHVSIKREGEKYVHIYICMCICKYIYMCVCVSHVHVCVCLMKCIQNVTQKTTGTSFFNGMPYAQIGSMFISPSPFFESVCKRPRRGGNHTLWVPIHPQAATKWDHQPVRVAQHSCFHCNWTFDYYISLIGSRV